MECPTKRSGTGVKRVKRERVELNTTRGHDYDSFDLDP